MTLQQAADIARDTRINGGFWANHSGEEFREALDVLIAHASCPQNREGGLVVSDTLCYGVEIAGDPPGRLILGSASWADQEAAAMRAEGNTRTYLP